MSPEEAKQIAEAARGKVSPEMLDALRALAILGGQYFVPKSMGATEIDKLVDVGLVQRCPPNVSPFRLQTMETECLCGVSDAGKLVLRHCHALELPFVTAVREMRQHQVAYFKTRSPDELQASKKAEREVDRMLAELEPKAQGRLF
jgi:hypothetical protein